MEEIECVNTIDCKQGAIRAVRFNVDGSYCLTCGADRKIRLWNPYRNIMLKTYGGHGNEVLDACGSCDSSHIVSCSSDKSVIYWDVSTGQPIRRYRGHQAAVNCVRFNEESSLAVSGSVDNNVMIWDCRSRRNEPVQVLNEAKDSITSLMVTDHEIVSGSVDCSIRRYDLRSGELQVDFMGAAVTSVSMTHDGQCILVGCADNTVRLIDKNTGEMLGEYMGHKTDDFNIESDILASDNHILSGSVDGDLFCWDLVSSKIVRKFVCFPGKTIPSLTVHPRKDIFICASLGYIKVWSNINDIPSVNLNTNPD